jgi:glycosyltransferase involved in cell wall biosynthesis
MKTLLYIGNKLSSHGFTVTSIETLGAFLKNEGFNMIYTSDKKNQVVRLIDMCFSVLKNKKKIDYVLIDSYSTSSFWYALVTSQLCRLFNLKYIPILRGGNLPNRLAKNPRLCNLLFKNAFINVAPSHYLLEAFKNEGYTNLKYIPNTIEIENYPFSSKEYNYPRLLWVRSFAKLYNPVLAVKVLIELKKKYPNATLTMVGPSKDESFEETDQFAKENQVEVNFTGKLTKKEWISLSADYNIFLNTTHFDNTPISVIEAMALGLAVVSTNVGGISYMLQHNKTALLVEDNDLNEMVFQVDRLLKESELSSGLNKCAKALVDKFDWKVVKNDWNSLLK